MKNIIVIIFIVKKRFFKNKYSYYFLIYTVFYCILILKFIELFIIIQLLFNFIKHVCIYSVHFINERVKDKC